MAVRRKATRAPHRGTKKSKGKVTPHPHKQHVPRRHELHHSRRRKV